MSNKKEKKRHIRTTHRCGTHWTEVTHLLLRTITSRRDEIGLFFGSVLFVPFHVSPRPMLSFWSCDGICVCVCVSSQNLFSSFFFRDLKALCCSERSVQCGFSIREKGVFLKFSTLFTPSALAFLNNLHSEPGKPWHLRKLFHSRRIRVLLETRRIRTHQLGITQKTHTRLPP